MEKMNTDELIEYFKEEIDCMNRMKEAFGKDSMVLANAIYYIDFMKKRYPNEFLLSKIKYGFSY